jgi:arylsulfatase
LVEDNHYTDQPYPPEAGYHLPKDLADRAIGFIRDSRQSQPDKPWYMFFCPGANHAPHHAPKDHIDKYEGRFDDGYEAYREWVLPRMIQKGVLPEGTELTPLNPMPEGTYSPGDTVRPWATLSDDEKKLFCRMAEVYAGFSEYTDHQVGADRRLPGGVRAAREHDHVLLCRQRRPGRGQPQRVGQREQLLPRLARRPPAEPRDARQAGQPRHLQPLPHRLGGGLSTPFRMFKRYSARAGSATRW